MTDEQRAILAEAREAIEAVEATLAEPRPQVADLPPVESRSERWRREADEQEERFARERATSQPLLTEWEAREFERDKLSAMVAEERKFVLDVLAHSLAAVRDEIIDHLEAKIAALEAELRQVKADQTKSGEVIPAWPGRKTA